MMLSPNGMTMTSPPRVQEADAAFDHRVEQILAGVPQALLVIGADRRLAFANPAAQALCHCINGRLMNLGQLEALQIERLLNLALGGHGARSSLWLSPGPRTGWLEASRVPVSMARWAGWPPDSLMLIIHLDEPALTQSARIDALCQQCRLTRTERYVLMLLADGLTVEDAARQLELRVSTLRSHVRNLLSKTQAPSLMQLVRWLGSAAALSF